MFDVESFFSFAFALALCEVKREASDTGALKRSHYFIIRDNKNT